jgi:co-chaperonin GroES (HSP10)
MIKVLGDRVLVALPPREDETVSKGAIVLVKDPDRFYTPTRGIVVALGEKTGTVNLDDVMAQLSNHMSGGNQLAVIDPAVISALAPAPFDVEVGDCVLFPASAGEEIHDGEVDYVILREAEIIGVVEPKETEAA